MGNGRFFEVYKPTLQDIAKAKELDKASCPRRYCWWWRSLSFEWPVPIKEGCTFETAAPKSNVIRPPYTPCRRKDPQFRTDHYEPREPHLLEDGFDVSRWSPPATES